MIDYVPAGDFKGAKIHERQLHAELEAAGVQIGGVGLVKDKDGKTVSVRIHLPSQPAAATKTKIASVLAAHEPEAEKNVSNPQARMDELRAKRRAGTKLTAAEQQELLDLLLGV